MTAYGLMVRKDPKKKSNLKIKKNGFYESLQFMIFLSDIVVFKPRTARNSLSGKGKFFGYYCLLLRSIVKLPQMVTVSLIEMFMLTIFSAV